MKRTVLIGTVTSGLLLIAGTAGATPPGPGVTARIIAQKTVNGKDYILREITIPPGQSTGWHYHDGNLYGVVKKGTLSHFDSTCKSDGVYRTGDLIVEPSGPSLFAHRRSVQTARRHMPMRRRRLRSRLPGEPTSAHPRDDVIGVPLRDLVFAPAFTGSSGKCGRSGD